MTDSYELIVDRLDKDYDRFKDVTNHIRTYEELFALADMLSVGLTRDAYERYHEWQDKLVTVQAKLQADIEMLSSLLRGDYDEESED